MIWLEKNWRALISVGLLAWIAAMLIMAEIREREYVRQTEQLADVISGTNKNLYRVYSQLVTAIPEIRHLSFSLPSNYRISVTDEDGKIYTIDVNDIPLMFKAMGAK